MDTLTIDLETRKLAQDLDGGWEALKRGEGGISCLVAWSSGAGRPFLFGENTLEDAALALEKADLVLSFNGVNFDLPVLEGVLGRRIAISRHLDLLQLIWQALAERGERKKGNSLGECARRTLSIEKNGDGLLAPQLADEGRWIELLDYCLNDVHLTRQLFIFAQEHGGIVGVDGELLKLDLPDWFRDAKL